MNISNPFAQATNLQPDNHSGWRNSGVTVTITGSGDHAPIVIYSRLDAGSWQNAVSPASVPVSGEGSHTVVFYAVNSVGVQSSPETGYVNIDLTAPATTATGLQVNDHTGWATTSQAVSFNAADALSGVSCHLLHDRRRRPAALRRGTRAGRRRGLARGALLVGRWRRQHRGSAPAT